MIASRRSFLAGAAACFAAPALVHASNLMPLRGTPLRRLAKAELLDQFGNVFMTTFKIERDEPCGPTITYSADFQKAPHSTMVAGWRVYMPEVGWVRGATDAPLQIEDHIKIDRLAIVDRGVALEAWSLAGARPTPIIADSHALLTLTFDPLAFPPRG